MLRDRLGYQLSRHFHRLWRVYSNEIGQSLILVGGTGIALTLSFSAMPSMRDMFWYLIEAYFVFSGTAAKFMLNTTC